MPPELSSRVPDYKCYLRLWNTQWYNQCLKGSRKVPWRNRPPEMVCWSRQWISLWTTSRCHRSERRQWLCWSGWKCCHFQLWSISGLWNSYGRTENRTWKKFRACASRKKNWCGSRMLCSEISGCGSTQNYWTSQSTAMDLAFKSFNTRYAAANDGTNPSRAKEPRQRAEWSWHSNKKIVRESWMVWRKNMEFEQT